jgi:flagellar basal body rod protein FlgB
MEESKKSNSKIIAIVLAVLLLGALAYTFYIKNDHKKITDAIEEEKAEIAQNLDSMIVKYEEAIGQNTSMSNELAVERDRIIAMRDSIKDLKATNYSLIRRYRKQMSNLEESNRRLFFITDSLTNINDLLTVDLDSANVKISKQLALYDTLTMQNIDLSEKVAIGSILKVNTAKILAMRERSSGKLVETSRASRTDAFRINFSIAKNEISEQGERQLYIQIVDSSGNTVASKGEITLFEDVQINYSDATTVNYMNEPIEVISLVEVDRDSIEKGIYIVNIYIENKIAGATQITLK